MLAMGVVIAALVRQIGVLHERIAPAGALAIQEGAVVGEESPRVAVSTLSGESPRDR